jgi:Bacterial extracellular solute-binding protein
MRRANLIIFVLFLLVAAGVVASQYVFKWSKGSFLNPEPPINITVLYSSELRKWVEPATDDFNSKNNKVGGQTVHVGIQVMDDGEAMRNILNGSQSPTVWIPASAIWVNLLNNQWRSNHQADLILRSGEYGTAPLALTPMVFVMFKERADAFTKKYPNPDWKAIQEAITTPGGWQALGGSPDWGTVKYGQTDPHISNAGLLAVTLATYTYFNKTTGLTSADLDNSDYQKWLDGLASGLVADAPPTAEQQMDDMLRYGPSRYDVVSIYESLVAQQIKNAPTRFGDRLSVFYPHLNIWSDHPYSILVSDQSSAEEKDAALLFEKYLYSPPVQVQALNVGFRPANPDVPLLNNDQNNPFNRYQQEGLQKSIPRTVLADTPPGDVLTRLQTKLER